MYKSVTKNSETLSESEKMRVKGREKAIPRRFIKVNIISKNLYKENESFNFHQFFTFSGI